jgi:hypothetical protein
MECYIFWSPSINTGIDSGPACNIYHPNQVPILSADRSRMLFGYKLDTKKERGVKRHALGIQFLAELRQGISAAPWQADSHGLRRDRVACGI